MLEKIGSASTPLGEDDFGKASKVCSMVVGVDTSWATAAISDVHPVCIGSLSRTLDLSPVKHAGKVVFVSATTDLS